MRNLFRFANFWFFSVVIALSSFAQTDNVLKTLEVRLPVTVKDKKKNPVAGLSKKDFIVLEDSVPQDITLFTTEKTNLPAYVGVLMDTSASTEGKLKFLKEFAMNFIYTVIKQRHDEVAFLTFNQEISLKQDFTNKIDLLDGAVNKAKSGDSKTSLYDAIWQISDEKLRNAPGRRVIVLITDGEDNFSRSSIEDAIDIAQRTETTIFGISTKEGFVEKFKNDSNNDYLLRLCNETGGEAFFVNDMFGSERALKKVYEEINSQYIFTYRPANQDYDGKRRKIEVRFKDKDNEVKYRISAKENYRAVKNLDTSLNAMKQIKEANPADVATLDAIMKAVYDTISGDAGKARDWDRFRTLFHKDARLIPTGKNQQTGVIGARVLSVEEYVTRASANMAKEGFFEREKARRVEQYGNIAHVFSTYESFHSLSDKKPFMRGINSFQLLNDGTRWSVVTIFWQGETPENTIPKKYLKSKK